MFSLFCDGFATCYAFKFFAFGTIDVILWFLVIDDFLQSLNDLDQPVESIMEVAGQVVKTIRFQYHCTWDGWKLQDKDTLKS